MAEKGGTKSLETCQISSAGDMSKKSNVWKMIKFIAAPYSSISNVSIRNAVGRQVFRVGVCAVASLPSYLCEAGTNLKTGEDWMGLFGHSRMYWKCENNGDVITAVINR